MSELFSCLVKFQNEVNTNESVVRLVKNWEPNIIIKSLNSEEIFTILIRDLKIESIVEEEQKSEHQILLEADEDILHSIFDGQTNPAEAALNGDLFVFGDQKDQIKLDAVTLLVWGM